MPIFSRKIMCSVKWWHSGWDTGACPGETEDWCSLIIKATTGSPAAAAPSLAPSGRCTQGFVRDSAPWKCELSWFLFSDTRLVEWPLCLSLFYVSSKYVALSSALTLTTYFWSYYIWFQTLNAVCWCEHSIRLHIASWQQSLTCYDLLTEEKFKP